MKFNLKNRPKPRHTEQIGTFYHVQDISEWFEGFEKELRDYLERLDSELIKGAPIGWPKHILKGILGE